MYRIRRRRASNERRQSCRYPAAPITVALGWWASDLWTTTRGVMLDISLEGARVAVEKEPPDGKVFLFAEGLSNSWVELQTLQRTALSRRPGFQVRLRFQESCPYNLFRSLVPGFHLGAGDDAPSNRGQSDEAHDWR